MVIVDRLDCVAFNFFHKTSPDGFFPLCVTREEQQYWSDLKKDQNGFSRLRAKNHFAWNKIGFSTFNLLECSVDICFDIVNLRMLNTFKT